MPEYTTSCSVELRCLKNIKYIGISVIQTANLLHHLSRGDCSSTFKNDKTHLFDSFKMQHTFSSVFSSPLNTLFHRLKKRLTKCFQENQCVIIIVSRFFINQGILICKPWINIRFWHKVLLIINILQTFS